ncbi:arogenate dehydratase 2-like [Triticum urartu]|uniref:Prephenate dehydratase domain-containing protein n=1 Tax=Triticum urartu TaxID=4572 RepID=A0A8R7Q6D1_TRIUA|nr:arogenate dehydratase 2-like [Triticum urartu]XP_048571423.1 arogenate dehydratase 2-like [Triticum urartu]XP_048571432.1 arogenate dehydratase 2-like [Triticum urartu]XP_048571433.1 arogenate dehydratase 2-like [Triticum urartu]
MASMTTPRLPFFPARARSAAAAFSSLSSSPLQCCPVKRTSFTNTNSAPLLFASRPGAPVADGWSADLNRRRASAMPVADSPLPAYSDPHALPLPLTSADLMESGGEGLKVAYQGFPGAYSESAAKKAYPHCQTVPCEHFDTAFQAVENCTVDRAVLPLENTLGGSIHRNYDLLLRHKLHIVGDVRLAVRHCLLANRGVKIGNLRSVMSHPQALAQCEHTLTELGIEQRQAVDDTAGAAKLVTEQMLQDTGAVASSLAAELYGLDILAENIQDEKENVTRFMMLARKPIVPQVDKPFKTSIVFSLEDWKPAQLLKALAVFALRDIDLTKIESRPHKKRPFRVADDTFSTPVKYFNYLFYVDLEASMADPKALKALGNLEEFAPFVRVLGSYPTDVSEV